MKAATYSDARRLAWAAATDAGTNSAARAGRTKWTADDYNAAAATWRRVMTALGFPVDRPPD